MVVIISKLLIFISSTLPCNMINISESTVLSHICIDSLPGFWLSVMHSRIKMFPFMKDSVSVHHPIIWTVLINLIPMLLSIHNMVHFIFNTLMKYRGGNQLYEDVNDSLMEWLLFWDIIKEKFIISSTLRSYLMYMFVILRFILIVFSTILITRHHFLN